MIDDKEKYESLWNKAESLRKNGDFEEAIAAYKDVIEQYPAIKNAYTFAALGDIYLTQRKLKLAEDYLKKALSYDPLNDEFHYLLGFTYSVSSQWDKAIKEFEFSLKEAPGKPEYMRGMGWALWNSGNKAEGLKLLQNALKISPDNVQILSDLAVAYTADLACDKARECAERVLAIDPHDEKMPELLGLIRGVEEISSASAHPRIHDRFYTCTLKVSLKDIKPLIWRRFKVPGNINLYDLHRVLQVVMGWNNYHLYEFVIGQLSFGDSDPDNLDDEILEARRARLETVLEGRKKITYTYDFGDEWIHDIMVEKIEEVPVPMEHAVCTEGERACPPEDCGSIPGYLDILKITKNPALKKREKYRELAEWLGDYDPEKFDLKMIRRRLSLMKLNLLGIWP